MKKLFLFLTLLALFCCAAAAESGDFAFNADDGFIKSYSGAGGDVVVPGEIDGVAVFSIDRQAFIRNHDITSLQISEPISVLDDSAVSTMDGLVEISLPSTLRFIGSGNFMDCESLTSVIIPPRVLLIEQSCFCWAGALKSVTFTGPVPAIQSGCFKSLPDEFVCYVPDNLLEEYRQALPEGLNVQPSGVDAAIEQIETRVEDFAFDPETGAITAYEGAQQDVAIPAWIDGVPVRSIGRRAFYSQSRIFRVIVPDGVESIGEDAFHGANMLLSIELPDSLTEIGEGAFYYGYNGMDFPWPASLKTIKNKAFASSQLSGDIHLPEGLETIGENAFGYAQMRTLYIPASVKSIGSNAFRNTWLKAIEFGGTDFEMAEDAFDGVRPDQVILPWNADADFVSRFTAYFQSLNENCEITLAQRPQEILPEDPAQNPALTEVGFAPAPAEAPTPTAEPDAPKSESKAPSLLSALLSMFTQTSPAPAMEPVPEPTDEPELTTEPVPVPAPTAEPEYAPAPEIPMEPAPGNTSESILMPAPEPIAEPKAAIEPVPEPQTTIEPTPQEIDETRPVPEVRYTLARASVHGHDLDSASLGGEYAAVFHEGGAADLVLAGTAVRDLRWTVEDGALLVEGFGVTPLRFTGSPESLNLLLFGAMDLTFEAE